MRLALKTLNLKQGEEVEIVQKLKNANSGTIRFSVKAENFDL